MIDPLPMADFWARLPFQSAPFDLRRYDRVNNLEGGDILSSQVRDPEWAGSITLPPMSSRQAADIIAQVEWLIEGNRRFEAYDLHRPGADQDRDGSGFAGSSAVVSGVDRVANTIDLFDVPPGYVLSRGDLVSFTLPGSGIQALHRVRETVTATGAGALFGVPVGPHLYDVSYLGAAVQAYRPFCHAVIVPGSFQPGEAFGKNQTGLRFAWRQKLEA